MNPGATHPRFPGVTRGVVLLGSLWLVLVASAWLLAPRGTVLCPVRRVTGFPCPTCGSTRAGVALVSLRPAEALRLNPFMTALMVGVPVFVAWRLTLGRHGPFMSSRSAARLVWIALGLLAVNWVYILATQPGGKA